MAATQHGYIYVRCVIGEYCCIRIIPSRSLDGVVCAIRDYKRDDVILSQLLRVSRPMGFNRRAVKRGKSEFNLCTPKEIENNFLPEVTPQNNSRVKNNSPRRVLPINSLSAAPANRAFRAQISRDVRVHVRERETRKFFNGRCANACSQRKVLHACLTCARNCRRHVSRRA